METDYIYLDKFFLNLKRSFIRILILSFISTFIFALYTLTIPNKYTSYVKLIERENIGSQATGISGSPNFLNSIISNGSSNVSKEILRFLAVIDSKDFFEKALENQEFSNLFYKSLNNLNLKETKFEDFQNEFSDMLRSDIDEETGIITISITTTEPNLSSDILISILSIGDKIYREMQSSFSNKALNYFNNKAFSSMNSKLSLISSAIAEDELRKLMLLEIDGYYLFEVLDSPRTPESKSYPSRSILCIIFATCITIFFSILSYIFSQSSIPFTGIFFKK